MTFGIGIPSLYVTLGRLVAKGFVDVAPDKDDGRQRNYRITPQGTQALDAKKELLAPLFRW